MHRETQLDVDALNEKAANFLFLFQNVAGLTCDDDDSYLNAMKASPSSPPTMCTPPSGILSPLKNCRMSSALADHAKFCSLIMTLIFVGVSATEPRSNEIINDEEIKASSLRANLIAIDQKKSFAGESESVKCVDNCACTWHTKKSLQKRE